MSEMVKLECPGCGAALEKRDQKFCEHCGSAIVRKAPEQVNVVVREAKTVKPLDLQDLRTILREQPNTIIDALNDGSWCKEIDDVELEQLLQRSTPELRGQVARSHCSLSETASRTLLRDSEQSVRQSLAKNPSISGSAVKILLGDHYNVRWELAQNPNTPVESLRALARDSAGDIQDHLASNPNTPVEVLRALGQGRNAWRFLGWRLAANPNTPVDVLNAFILSAKGAEIGDSVIYKERLKRSMQEHPRFHETDWSPYETSYETSCFPASARVLTPTGHHPIADIEPGDLVVSYAPDGSTTLRPVTRKLLHGNCTIQRVVLADGEPLRATANHKVLTARGWLQVKDLKPGDELVRIEGRSTVVEVEAEPTSEPVYNLYTAGEHTFVVEGVVVHNFTHLRVLRTWMHRFLVDPLAAAGLEPRPLRPQG